MPSTACPKGCLRRALRTMGWTESSGPRPAGTSWWFSCNDCEGFQVGPEWICHKCRSVNLGWHRVSGRGRVYSWERVWHPVHPALKDACPYMVVLVELSDGGNVRMVGNLAGDPRADLAIG